MAEKEKAVREGTLTEGELKEIMGTLGFQLTKHVGRLGVTPETKDKTAGELRRNYLEFDLDKLNYEDGSSFEVHAGGERLFKITPSLGEIKSHESVDFKDMNGGKTWRSTLPKDEEKMLIGGREGYITAKPNGVSKVREKDVPHSTDVSRMQYLIHNLVKDGKPVVRIHNIGGPALELHEYSHHKDGKKELVAKHRLR